ncbi:methylated-DNA--[protein]-cysteine S-methyltransferase [Sporosarcina sp.]|uniref:methylated-DNA--[protein]-cysteine S-methyltransferase n=1 Tax=Sporosarcina sp. TaxID=49982 RepID=UPI002605A2E8|nr:methylated-DNA--[protein]-cysteine S-methyltransferase [Sporosarcina sp.]
MMYWTSFDAEDWHVTLAANERGICYIGLANDSEERMKEWISKQSSEVEILEDADRFTTNVLEIKSYLSGKIQKFVSSTDCIGTSFQLSVWQALRAIPYGETVTYSDIAKAIGRPAAVRAVASAIARNPLLLIIPCHRVVAKDGSLSGFRDGQQVKERLLELEKANSLSPVDNKNDCATL